jgi:transposase
MELNRYRIMMKGKGKAEKAEARLHAIRYAQRHGKRAAAREYGCSKNTVKLWLRRFEEEGMSGLNDKRDIPRNIPHKTTQAEENYIIKCRQKVPCYGPQRLQLFFGVKRSEGAIKRILKEHGLTRIKRKKYHKRNDLREVKARYKALTHHQEDTKHLYDIPRYWTQMKMLGLPKYQYTIRDTKSGFMALGYGSECSEVYAGLFTEAYIEHLKRYGIEPSELKLQSDNGSEFGGTRRKSVDYGYVYMIEQRYGARHGYIPPGMKNANADVESAHSLIESEFYDIEDFRSRAEFFRKAQLYQDFFNMIRPNFSKGTKTPWEIISQDRADIKPEVLLFPVIDIDALFRVKFSMPSGGQVIPAFAVFHINPFTHLFLSEIRFSPQPPPIIR